ncbi:MAG: TRAP transporter large permease [Lachnospiraceae bacterium]|nr:TRAP transporter large permease [Lachnospiraceae bacterium]
MSDVMVIFLICMLILMALLFLGVPIPYCFAGALIFLILNTEIPIRTLLIWGYSQMISPTLLAAPMFIVAGNLIGESGIAERLLEVARIFVGKIKGALGVVCVITCGVIGAISGSAFTGLASLGTILIPELRKEGYSNGFATALITCSSILGVLIPPSVPLIIYGWTTNTSILAAFLSTVIPGVMTILTFSIINLVYARKFAVAEPAEEKTEEETERLPGKRKVIIGAIPALMMPVIILGGIYGGIFTASEAASVCAVIALIVGIFFYRRLKGRNIIGTFRKTSSSIGAIFMMIYFSMLMSQVLTQLQIPQKLVEVFLGITDNKYLVLLILNIFLLLVGMIVNDSTAILLVAPLLLPVAQSYGISSVQFAAIMVVNLAAGGLTPPYASILYFGMRIGHVKMGELMKSVLVFLLVGYLPVMLATTYIEPVTMFLPRLFGY